MKISKNKIKYMFDEIFTGTSPKYEEEVNEFIIIGQKNNSKNGIDLTDCKFTNEYFYKTRPKKEFLRFGDIIVNSLGGGTCGRVGFYNLNNQVLTDGIPYILRNRKTNKYFYYLLKSKQEFLENISVGATNQVSLKDFDLLNLEVDIISEESEQKKVVDYLDKNCAVIDDISTNIQNQINVLENYKKSVIAEAVTKGLNANVEMKKSPISWANNIPKHWNYMPNKYVMSKKKKICSVHNNEDIISLSMNGVIIRDLEAGGKMPSSFDGYQFVYPGNLLMCLFDYDVTPRCIGYINNYGITSPAYSQFVVKNGNCAKYYYYYYLMIDNIKGLLHLAKNLRHSFTEDEFGKIFTIVPSIQEQKEIADYLDKKCAEIDDIIKIKKEQLATIEVYKKSLIYEYVTGKKVVND